MSTLNADALDGAVFISDNLPFLKSLDTESVDLVCIDPPFGKMQTFVGTLKQPLSAEERRIERELMDSWGVYDPRRRLRAWDRVSRPKRQNRKFQRHLGFPRQGL